ncbi:tripartite motif-containing protein 10 [Drosophila pseudoobscura]|uniref:Tripartite motif-containing protein 10 n=1 Tax=Drosophila pseudoobscura pseudoobscura TaxID=46245 RepID=A0A6I8V262_DROPS|nr:tripartite motif-containing protein 10 [Drosophila pseudoobscura]
MYLSGTMTDNVCIFCLDEQRLPHRIPCGHSFCSECFERYLQVGLDTRCPLCRQDFRPHAQGEPLDRAANTERYPLDEDDLTMGLIEDFGSLSGSDSLQSDTLLLTLTEQECRFFDELYREAQMEISVEDL